MTLPNKPISGLGKRDLGSTERTDSGRPSRKPGADYKKVERRGEKDTHQKKGDAVVEEEKASSDSVFDLAAGKKITGDAKKASSPLEIAAHAAAAGAKDGLDADASPDLAGLSLGKASTQDTSKKGQGFGQAQDDLAFVNPNAKPDVGIANMSVQSETVPTSRVEQLQKLVDQIEPTLYTVKQGGITDTAIKIQNPPIFAGSELVVRSYDSAKGEFNIAFNNLTQEAKALLDNHQAALMKTLEERGYVAHMVVTSTQPYEKILTDASNVADQQNLQKQREDQEGQQDSEGGQKRQS